MTVAALALTDETPTAIDADALVIGVRKTDTGPELLTADPALIGLQDALASVGISGAQDELRRLPAMPGLGARSIALIGVGPDLGVDSLRYASGSVARQLTGITSLALALPTASAAELFAVLEGAAIGAYSYTDYRSSSLDSKSLPASSIIVCSEVKDTADLPERATAVATAIHTVRDLVNAPPSDLYPETFASAVGNLAEGLRVDVTIMDEAALEAGGFGGILGVGRGSSRGPRLVKLSYSPADARRHLALVGKGITFDSGGLSLKPAASMIGMKYDMTGAATVLAVTLAAARLSLDVRITAWMCLAENLPSGTAARPNDVLRIRGGKTVEVLNTDAEGRLVLADGLVAAGEEQPDAIIDVATLTGAAGVALGNRHVGAMGDDALVARVVAAATASGETFWPMPLPSDLRSLLNSDIADIANVKPGHTAGGMLIAGIFLQEFIGQAGDGTPIPWAHLDIAGSANNSSGPWGFVGKGPTGVSVRALLQLAEEFSRS